MDSLPEHLDLNEKSAHLFQELFNKNLQHLFRLSKDGLFGALASFQNQEVSFRMETTSCIPPISFRYIEAIPQQNVKQLVAAESSKKI